MIRNLNNHRLRCETHRLDIAETQSEVDHVDRVLVDVPTAISAERAKDREPGDVEIMEDEDPVDQRRQPVEQHARRDHAHAFGAHG